MHLPWTTQRIVQHRYSVLPKCHDLYFPQYRLFGCLFWLSYIDSHNKWAAFYTLSEAQAYLDSLCPPPKPAHVPPTPIPRVIHPYPPLTPAERRSKLIASLAPVSNPLCDTRPELADALKRATERIDDRSET